VRNEDRKLINKRVHLGIVLMDETYPSDVYLVRCFQKRRHL